MKNRKMFRRKPERFGAAGGGRMEFRRDRGVEAGGEGTECNKGEERAGRNFEMVGEEGNGGRSTVSEVLTSRLVGLLQLVRAAITSE